MVRGGCVSGGLSVSRTPSPVMLRQMGKSAVSSVMHAPGRRLEVRPVGRLRSSIAKILLRLAVILVLAHVLPVFDDREADDHLAFIQQSSYQIGHVEAPTVRDEVPAAGSRR